MIRVDYETRDPIPAAAESALLDRLPAAVAESDIVLISDYDKGVCTPTLLRGLIDACRAAGVRVIADPIRVGRLLALPWRPLHDSEPPRSLARHRHDDHPARGRAGGRPEAGHGPRDGMRPRDARPRRHGAGPRRRPARAGTRPGRGRSTTSPARATWSSRSSASAWPAAPITTRPPRWGTSPAGLEVEKIGVALLSRQEILRDLIDHHRPEAGKRLDTRGPDRRGRPEATGGPDGRLHERLLRPPPRRPCPLAPRGGRAGRLPRRRAQLRRERPAAQGPDPPDQLARRTAPSCSRRWNASMPSPCSMTRPRWP